MISVTKIFYIIFGVFTILGGLMGYLKANSKASLIAGSISGVLLLVAALFLLPQSLNAGLILGLLVSVAMLGQFLPMLLHKEAKPHVILSVLFGISSVVLTLLSWYRK